MSYRDAAISRLISAVADWRDVFGRADIDFHTRKQRADDVMHAYDQLVQIPLEVPTEPKARATAPLTSHWAAQSMRNNTFSWRILRMFMTYADLTVDEIEQHTGGKHQTVSARVNELRNSGWIAAVGTRSTRSKRQAETYRLTQQGIDNLQQVKLS